MADRYSRGERLILKLASLPPRWLMEQPERVLPNLACLLIGVIMLLPPAPSNVLSTFPVLGRVMIGIFFILGATVSLLGNTTGSRLADRWGAVGLACTSFFMMVILFGEVGLRAILTGVIFGAICAAKSLRLIRTSAVRIRIRHHLLEMVDLKSEGN